MVQLHKNPPFYKFLINILQIYIKYKVNCKMNVEYKNKTFHYFYKITNLINNKYYYGVHSTDNLNDGYMGSGKRIAIAIKKYGVENFKKEILKYFDSRIDMFEYEHSIVNENILKDPLCYNLAIGGKICRNIKGYLCVSEDNGLTWKYVTKIEYQQNKEKYITTSSNKVVVSDNNGLSWKMISKEEFNKNKEKYIITTFNKITVKDKLGKIYFVCKDDERYISGELVPIWCRKTSYNRIKRKDSKNNDTKKF